MPWVSGTSDTQGNNGKRIIMSPRNKSEHDDERENDVRQRREHENDASASDDQSAFFGPNARRQPREVRGRVWQDPTSSDDGRDDRTPSDDDRFNREQFNRSQFGAAGYRQGGSGEIGRSARTFRSRGDRSTRQGGQFGDQPSRDDRRGGRERDDRFAQGPSRGARPDAGPRGARPDAGPRGARPDAGPRGARPDAGRSRSSDRDGARGDARSSRFGRGDRAGDSRRPDARPRPGDRGAKFGDRRSGAGQAGNRKQGTFPSQAGGRRAPAAGDRRRFDPESHAQKQTKAAAPKKPAAEKRPPATTLVKALVSMQWASRSLSIRAIQDGRVTVNEAVVRYPNIHVRPGSDALAADGTVLLRKSARPVTVVFHKPAGLSGSREDGKPSLYSALPNRSGWFMPFGSLTKQASGIVIVSNDPAHQQETASPYTALTADVLIKLHRHPKKTELTKLQKLVKAAWPADAEVISIAVHSKGKRASWIKISHRKGQMRALMVALKTLELEPLRVIRSRVGPFSINDLPAGAWYQLADSDILSLDELIKQKPADDSVSLTSIWQKITAKIAEA
ncbi:MAG: hypothetical protein FGM24_05390 [Candidatus Kapabacteria bacterium]|nr:hypothetical protein [Candidatus Kapabacteria bacterium]